MGHLPLNVVLRSWSQRREAQKEVLLREVREVLIPQAPAASEIAVEKEGRRTPPTMVEAEEEQRVTPVMEARVEPETQGGQRGQAAVAAAVVAVIMRVLAAAQVAVG